MRQLLLLCIGCIVSFTVFSATGDTTKIQSHNETHWDWNGNFKETTQFPTGSTTYRKIIMHYVLGCPSGGCSGWDYTTRILLEDSLDPTTTINYELTRIITPYAGDKQNGWFHEYRVDVTDFAPLLQGQKVINAKYDGWQDGFTVSIYFDFIEGTPARDVVDITQLYEGRYYSYGDAANPIENALDARTIDIDSDMSTADLKVVTTGHGFGDGGTPGANPQNCSEFCSKFFQVLVDNSAKYTTTVWKDDCGAESLFPQTGTWIYNRAGWCPGSSAVIENHDLSSHLTAGNQHSLDINWESYFNAAANSTYLLEANLFQYGTANFTNDVELYDILNPTDYDRYSKNNPGCAEPTVVIRNGGSAALTSATIMYYVDGGKAYYVNWTGNLGFMETTEVSLPIPPENFFKGSRKFNVKVTYPNGVVDENPTNDLMSTGFNIPTVHVSEFDLKIKTNNRASENWYILTNSYGDTIVHETNLTNNSDYEYNLNLDPGCYSLYVHDSQGDGFSFWADANQGTGRIQLTNLTVSSSDPKFLLNLETEFGSFIQYDFSVGYNLTAGNNDYSDDDWAPSNGGNDTNYVNSVDSKYSIQQSFNVYPNPTQNDVTLALKGYYGSFDLTIVNQVGAVVIRDVINEDGGSFRNYDVSKLTAGIYFVTLNNGTDRITKKLIIK